MDDKILYSLIRGGFLGTIFYISKNIYEYLINQKIFYEKEIKKLKQNNEELRNINNNYLQEIEEKDKIITNLLDEYDEYKQNKKKKERRDKIVIEYEDFSD